MAVYSFNEHWEGRAHTYDERRQRKYIRSFIVLTTATTDGPREIRDYAACPQIGDSYVNDDGSDLDIGAFVTAVNVTNDGDNPYKWMVNVEYSSRSLDQNFQNENPLLRPAEISWTWERQSRPADKDIAGEAITNSISQSYDPFPEKDAFVLVLKITRNQSAFDANFYATYQDAVNTDSFFGFSPMNVRVVSIAGSRQNENNFSFWKVDYEFHINNKTWILQVLDRGSHYYDATDELVPFLDKYRQPLSDPDLLNGSGKPLREATTTLTAAIGAGEVAVAVANGNVFGRETTQDPALAALEESGVWLRISTTISDEIVRMTEPAAPTSITIERGKRGTAPQAHANGATVRQLPFYAYYDIYPLKAFAPLGLI